AELLSFLGIERWFARRSQRAPGWAEVRQAHSESAFPARCRPAARECEAGTRHWTPAARPAPARLGHAALALWQRASRHRTGGAQTHRFGPAGRPGSLLRQRR